MALEAADRCQGGSLRWGGRRFQELLGVHVLTNVCECVCEFTWNLSLIHEKQALVVTSGSRGKTREAGGGLQWPCVHRVLFRVKFCAPCVGHVLGNAVRHALVRG